MKKNFPVFAILIVLGICLIYYFLIFQGLQTNISTKQKLLDDKRVELDKAEQQAKRVEELKREIENLKIELDYMTEKLPPKKRIPELLVKLQEVGMQSGVTFQQFKPGKITTAELYDVLAINMKIYGSYHQIASFFNKIGSLSRIVNVFDVSMTREKKDIRFQSATFELRTYIYKSVQEKKPGKKTPGTKPVPK